jgi:cell wall-associated NlpC family hydrolase
MNPYESAKMFFLGGHDGQRGLLDFKNRDQMSLTQAAQAVQVSAFPDAYAKHESAALGLLGGTAPVRGVSENNAAGQPLNPQPLAAAPVAPVPTTVIDNRPGQKQPESPAAQIQRDVPGVVEGAVGIQSVSAPGVEAVDTPGIAAATEPVISNTIPTLDFDTFNAQFPDAPMLFGAGDARRGDLVSTAMSFIGTPYVWGGNGRDGVDCSGLVQQVYRGFGIELPRLSADQARSGQRVDLGGLKAGDLVAWDNSSRNSGADHIAVYAGDGYIIEAPRPGLAVRRRKLTESDYAEAYGVQIAQLS